ncbi:MAG: MmcQ/YjbR family DNA-binding protein [Fimbriimonas sp.]
MPATLDDVRRICSSLPGAIEGGEERFGFSVLVKGKGKGFVWTWAERVHPRKPKVINESVVAVVVPSLLTKDLLIEANPNAFFTEDHYNGYPAILVRLDRVELEELESVLYEAWKCKAPPEAVCAFEMS